MDEIVLRAMHKWPNVPSVYGWLALDGRGNWSIKGERIVNSAITDFIGRNYARDQQGRWYFQNGPQKVFVRLAYTPFVLRTKRDSAGALSLITHTAVRVGDLRAAFLDEKGGLLVDTDSGIGSIHDQDLAELMGWLTGAAGAALPDDAIEQLLAAKGRDQPIPGVYLRVGPRALPLSTIDSARVATRFGFNPDPQPAPGEPEC